MSCMPFFHTNLLQRSFHILLNDYHAVTQNMNIWLMEFTLPRHFLSNCTKPGKWAIVYFCVRGIDLICLYDFLVRFGGYSYGMGCFLQVGLSCRRM